MNAQSANRRLENLERATARLAEALAAPKDTPFIVDATIQRFEFAFELCWKTMRGFLELEASSANLATPRAVVKAAYAAGWIDDESEWIGLLQMRNATSHIYNEKMAQDVYGQIGKFAPLLHDAVTMLRAKAV
ncbi:MAG TPA: nucleotidyltransferase substrate binding protein [Rhizomicrobium sp.]|jgi:nucleotidyltransferase substrate binding protein (TIGR01987 family)|nr:nucleotidyltransferase substrate binding protein [Rhizomicrobium sp.]